MNVLGHGAPSCLPKRRYIPANLQKRMNRLKCAYSALKPLKARLPAMNSSHFTFFFIVDEGKHIFGVSYNRIFAASCHRTSRRDYNPTIVEFVYVLPTRVAETRSEANGR
jgi:hypothetical protein